MRDKRESTRSNGEERESMAGRLPKVLAARLRSARRATGLSQGAVADAMRERGFTWRQTTVAKTEAADRPVLFAEVAALAQIYKRDFEYFLYVGSELDVIVDDSLREFESIKSALAETAEMLEALENDKKRYECMIGVAMSILRYRNTGDSGWLLGDFRALMDRYGYQCMTLEDVYDSIDVTHDQLRRVDEVALQESARRERGFYDAVVQDGVDNPVPSELLQGVLDFSDGKPISEPLIYALRQGAGWVDTATSMLVDVIISAVDTGLRADG
ncbi:helix-turn-helix domain-containing protein [Streptomyces antibioticus]|uniref:helix-turn-helix domain-containing protein n=1 Tax=Streptomyces antibioticus TaxID=1890 RepID=UPI003D71DDA8